MTDHNIPSITTDTTGFTAAAAAVVPPAPDVTTTDGGLTDDTGDDAATTGGTGSFLGMLTASFDEEVAKATAETAAATPKAVTAVESGIDPETLRPRVAILNMLLDNSGSMGDMVSIPDPSSPLGFTERRLIDLAAEAHDFCLNTVQRMIGSEPVSVLATAGWLNAPFAAHSWSESTDTNDAQSTIYPYTRIEGAPRFNGQQVTLSGATPLYRRFSQVLAATAAEMLRMENANKTVFGMSGFVTDGENTSTTGGFTFEKIRTQVRGFRRAGNIAVFAMYTGKILKPGDAGYETERREALYRLESVGGNIRELERDKSITHEDLLRMYFEAHGFDPELIFLPGDNPAAIAKAFVAVSQLAVSVSKGSMPKNLTKI